MKKLLSLLLALSLILLASCAKTQGNPEDGKLSVVVSFYPMYDFTLKVAGDLVNIKTLVPTGTEPHDWEPTAADIKAVSGADLFIYSGVIESWAGDLLRNRTEDSLTIMAAEGLPRLTSSGEFSGEFDRATDLEHEADIDGHVWLTPKGARGEAKKIKDVLILADPANSEAYAANFESFAAELDRLDRDYLAALAPHQGKTIVVSHESFGYLCAEYGINQLGIEGLSPDSEPLPSRMAEIIDFVKDNHVTTIFFEELVSPRVAEAIASDTGAKPALLNPLEGLTEKQLDAGEDYLSIMRQNLEAIVASFEGE